MKKTFKLTQGNIKIPRQFDAIKHEVKKYMKRERRRQLPEGADYWDFDCKYGIDEASSEVIHVSDINKFISQAETDGLESFYLEVMVKACKRGQAPEVDE